MHWFFLISLLLVSCNKPSEPQLEAPKVVAPPVQEKLLEHEDHQIGRNSTVFESLTKVGFTPLDVQKIVAAAKEFYDLSRIPAKMKFRVGKADGVIQELTFYLTRASQLKWVKKEDQWPAQMIDLPKSKKLVYYKGQVKDSLWTSGVAAKMPPYLIARLAEVFSWEIDFYRQIRPGDSWSLVAERIFVEKDPVGWGKILFAQYTNQGTDYQAFYYVSPDGRYEGHFNQEGESLRRRFLKSPLKFGRISSRFSRRRFHPIKKIYRPHLGVDYAAPTGTPVRSIGKGTITKIGRFGGAGKMIALRHPGQFKTRYLHLSRFARGMKRGKQVKQGQIIGYVGRTGSATGPHLHFELYSKGHFVDPLKVKLPPSTSLPKEYKPAFSEHTEVFSKNQLAKLVNEDWKIPYLRKLSETPELNSYPLVTF